jgi:hypothetical protein
MLRWSADSLRVHFSPFDPNSACLVDTAKVDSIAAPLTPADSAANVITAQFCSSGSNNAGAAYFLVDLPGTGHGKLMVVAINPADTTQVLESNEVTFNGGVYGDYAPTVLSASRVHQGNNYVATITGAGLSSIQAVSLTSGSASWSAPLSIVEQAGSRLTAAGEVAAPLPEALVQVSSSFGVAQSPPLAADELLAPQAAPPYAAYIDASRYVRPKDFAFFYDGLGKFHLFYIRHNTKLSDCTQSDLNERKFAHVSGDLYSWSAQDTAFAVGAHGWDKAHVWAPSIVQNGNTYYMFYTGVDSVGDERIGYATTTNINANPISWTRQTSASFGTNNTHNLWAKQSSGMQHCRDPFVMKDPSDSTRWLMYYTANLAIMSDWQTVGVARSAQNSLTAWTDIGPLYEISYLHNYSLKSESPHVFPHVNLSTGSTSWWFFDTSDYAIMANRNESSPTDTAETYSSSQWDFISQRLYQHLTNSDPRVQYWNGSEYLKVSTQEYLAAYNSAVGLCGVVSNPDSNAIWIVEMHWTKGAGTNPDVFGLAPGVTAVGGHSTTPGPRFGLRLAELRPGVGRAGFSISLPVGMRVRLDVYDILGRRVRTVVDGELPDGVSVAEWDGRDPGGALLGSGVYFARLTSQAGTQSVRVPLFH